MIATLALLHTLAAHAEAGRATVGADAALSLAGSPRLRGLAGYGITRRLGVTAEVGGGHPWAVSAGAGPTIQLLHTSWWHAELALMPELVVPGRLTQDRSVELGSPRVVGRTGLRVSWLAFWGLSFTGRVDEVVALDGAARTELGLGASLRM